MTDARPPLVVHLAWEGGLRFAARAGERAVLLDGSSQAGPSPVEALAFALAGCMATDVVDILNKGRLDVKALRAELTGWRAETEPRRFLKIDLRFHLTGDVPDDRIERALALSREKYCSVWHSLSQDIDLTLAYDVEKG